MKFYVEGDLTEEEFIKIGKFFRNLFKDMTKVVKIFITEGMENKSKEECAIILAQVFEGSKFWTKTYDVKIGEEKHAKK